LDFFGSIGVLVYAFHRLGRAPGIGDLMVGLALFGVALLLLYSVWILVVSVSFRVVKVDNLSYLSFPSSTLAAGPSTCSKGRCV